VGWIADFGIIFQNDSEFDLIWNERKYIAKNNEVGQVKDNYVNTLRCQINEYTRLFQMKELGLSFWANCIGLNKGVGWKIC